VGVISCRISACYFPLPLVPSRRGRGKFTFYEFIISENRIIITFDLDFGEIVALSKREKVSIILFRLHNTRTSHLINRLSTVLEDSAEALGQGAVVVVEESRHRVRYLPPGEK
jgi:hypothetical protein